MKKFYYFKVLLALVVAVAGLFPYTCNIAAADEWELIPVIEVRPGLNLEVGEEVLFTAESSILNYSDPTLINKARFEWDFGDGYALKFGFPNPNGGDSGMSTVHYFMSPGTFTVTLTISVFDQFHTDGTPSTDTPIFTESTSIQVTVTGEAPIDGFEILRAPFNARLAQFITVKIPDAIASNSTNRLVVTLIGENNNSSLVLLDKTDLNAEEQFLLEQRNLPADNYRLIVELKDAGGNVLSVLKEKFSKTYDGIPKVGINEWNAICVDGEPFFPVSVFMLDDYQFWKYTDAINTTYTIGYYDEAPNHNHTPELWLRYLDSSEERGWMGAGPGRGTFAVGRNIRNKSLELMQEFVNAAKDHNAMLLWEWADEPNMGGRYIQVPPTVVASWTYATREADQNHPVTINLYGYDFLPYYGDVSYYNYKDSAFANGGKRAFYADILTMDVYPLEHRKHASLFNKDRGVIDLWVQAIDNFRDRNLGLIPFGIFVEVNDIYVDDRPPVTNEQALMEMWLAVTHGAKMINYFQYFVEETIRYDAMKEFTAAMDTYGRIILGPDNVEPVSDNSNVRTNRVETLTRKDGDDIYLFAVRLTEPEPLPEETNHQAPEKQEPDYISTTFTVPGLINGSADVLDEHGEVIQMLSVENGQFTDTFGKCDYRIYRISGNNQTQEASIIITGPDSVAKGQTFSVNIGFNAEEKILAAEIGIGYNDELVEYLGYEQIAGGLSMIASGEGDPGNPNTKRRFVLAGEGTGAITDDIPLLQLIFKAKETTGLCEIEVTKAEFGAEGETEGEGVLVLPSLDGIVVEILHQSIPGDITGDSIVNVLDLYEVAKNYWKTSADADWDDVKKADVSGDVQEGVPDGKIDFADLVYVALKILE